MKYKPIRLRPISKRGEIENWRDEELIDEAQSLHACIHISGCFNTDDLARYDLIIDELYKRGLEPEEHTLTFRRR